MTLHDPLIDRLRAADPVDLASADDPHAEVLLQRIVADDGAPSGDNDPAPARRPRRRLALAGAAVAAVTLVVVSIGSLGGSAPGFADRAYAAITAPDFFHVVQRSTYVLPPGYGENEKAPGRVRGRSVVESYIDARNRTFHFVARGGEDGRPLRLVYESAGGRGGATARFAGSKPSRVADLDPDGTPHVPERYDPTADFRTALKSGRVRDDGPVRFRGRTARRLVVDDPPQRRIPGAPFVRSSRSVFIVDATTLYPLRWSNVSRVQEDGKVSRLSATTDYTTFETLPRTPANRALLRFGSRP